jgi:hypothetical protein
MPPHAGDEPREDGVNQEMLRIAMEIRREANEEENAN